MRPRRILVLGLAALAGGLVLAPRHPRLLWNASASVPIGLYRLRPVGAPRVGDLVAIQPPPALAAFLAARRYLPRGALLLKPVAAVAGQRVCRSGRTVTIDGRSVAQALRRDRQRRPLPGWSGCRRLAAGAILVMNPAVPDSFDGRYFGPLPASALRARAQPLWRPAPHPPPCRRAKAAFANPTSSIPNCPGAPKS